MGFQQGLSGLNASSKQLEVIGNNVANASTVGFKQSTAQFADVYAASLSGSGGAQIGIGTKVAAVAQQFVQGNVTSTGNTLDMAINGQGFYRMDNNGAISYSRNGQFQLDKNGFIVNAQGIKLTGYGIDSAGNIVAASPQPLQIPTTNLNPAATSLTNLGLNLDSRLLAPTAAAFSPSNPSSFNNSTSVTIYDSLGNSHVATTYFAKASVSSVQSGAFTTAVATAPGQTFTLSINGSTVANFTSAATGDTVTAAQLDTAMASFLSTHPAYSMTGTFAAGTAQITDAAGSAMTIGLASTYGTTSSTSVQSGTFTQPVASAAGETFTLNIDGIPAASFTSAAAGDTVTAAQLDTAMTAFLAANPTYSMTGSFAAGTAQISNSASPTMTIGLATTYVTTPGSFAGAGFIGTVSGTPGAFASAGFTGTVTPIPVGAPANATTAWQTYLTVDNATIPAAGTALGTLCFDSNGTLVYPTPTAGLTIGQMNVSVPFANGATSPQSIVMDFSGTSQYGANFGVNSLTQNGYTSGQLTGFSTASDGTIQGRYSNGQTNNLGQIVLANFSNAQGLQPQGNNLWVETSTSGAPLVGAPGTGSMGVIQSAAVEDSNVDLTAELVNMITAQRVYQANAQTIKTQDAVLQTLVNLR
ncbi:MAG: flagellar hook-basal body complex protein [Sideroxydans sp.]|nr:flagellar hook-basal body complex protein [Sideroxydans sp.]